ncbi:MAG: hypothetical protein WC604_02815 [Candidatus Gracilibacteria bacterium]
MGDSTEKAGDGEFEFSDGSPENNLSDEEANALAESLVSGCFSDYEAAKRDRAEEVKHEFERNKAQILELIKQPDAVVVKENGKIIGVGDVAHVTCPDYMGRPVCIFRNGTVLPECRGLKIFSRMADLLIEKGKRIYPPNAIFTVCTRNPIVKETFKKRGYNEISLSDFDTMTQLSPKSEEELERRMANEKDGWCVLISDSVPITKRVGRVRGLVGHVLSKFRH